MKNRNYKSNMIRFVGDVTPTNFDNLQVGDKWYNTKLNKVCHYLQNGNFKYWDCLLSQIGYILGGTTDGGVTHLSNIEKINFAFDSIAMLTLKTPLAARNFSGCNSSRFGYSLGLATGSNVTNSYICRLDTISDSFMVINGYLSESKCAGATCNSSQYGYILGGSRVPVSTYASSIERINFSIDGNASVIGNLNTSSAITIGYNSSQHGFSSGGLNNSNLRISNIERIAFPFDSGIASNVGFLYDTIIQDCGFNSSLYGFNCDGYNSVAALSLISRVQFPFDSGTASTVGNTLSSRHAVTGFNSNNNGYISSGYIPSGRYNSSIEKIQFPFDSGLSQIVMQQVNASDGWYNGNGIDNTDFVSQFV